jgi:predicted O-methyltransferase YrrM
LIWLLAAVTANEANAEALQAGAHPSLVIGTEYEEEKADKAIQHVKEAFEGQIPDCLKLLRGDLLETLAGANFPNKSIDALLLDIWAPVALPTLKILLPKLRIGAAVFADNTTAPANRYAELFDFVRDPANGFQSVTFPFSHGFDMYVFVGTK